GVWKVWLGLLGLVFFEKLFLFVRRIFGRLIDLRVDFAGLFGCEVVLVVDFVEGVDISVRGDFVGVIFKLRVFNFVGDFHFSRFLSGFSGSGGRGFY
ncbi:hypothetical protein, partial [Bacillus subtilis]|uniref:hypothetical protein n=1 Tax=Bacillus subtilis TaxID=1423 RepID=UPI0016433537